MMEKSLARHWKRNFILVVLANACSSISFQMLTPVLPIYVVEILGRTEFIAGLVVGTLTITTILVRPFSGKAIDLFNHRTIGIIGMLLCAITIFFYQFAQHTSLLIILRLIHGVGWAIVTGTTVTIASMSIPKNRLGGGMGLFGVSSVFSLAIAPGLALYVINAFNFQILFVLASTLVVIGALLVYFVAAYHQAPSPQKWSWKQTISGLFVPAAVKPALVNLCVSQTLSVILTFTPLYAAQYHIKNMGPFFTAFALTLLLSRLVTGRLIDAKGFRIVILPGLGVVMVSIALLSFASTLPVFIMAAILYGIGYGCIHPSLQAIVVARSLPEQRGAANSTLLLSSDLGFGIGATLYGFFAHFLGYQSIFPLLFVPVAGAVLIHLFYRSKKNIDVKEQNRC